jgi:hypothetical protein
MIANGAHGKTLPSKNSCIYRASRTFSRGMNIRGCVNRGDSVQQTQDQGCCIVVGNTWPFGSIGESKIYLIKTDGKGGKVWAKTFGGGDSAYGLSVRQATDGGYIIAGKKELESADDYDICLELVSKPLFSPVCPF